MIEGIKIDVTTKEMHDHIIKRAHVHSDKAARYERDVTALRNAGVEDEPRATSVDPIRQLDHKVREHRDKAAFFFFMAEHLVEGEIYRLSESDLSRLEIAAMYF